MRAIRSIMFKLVVFCPDDETVIQNIIHAATGAGAGVIGHYTKCAFVSKGTGQWLSGKGSHPTIGKPGELTQIQEARIEMQCPDERVKDVNAAVTSVHPYEEPAIEFYRISLI